MDERIKEHLKHLNRYYLHLRDIQKLPFSAFEENALYNAAAERFLQLMIESCLNIGNRLISVYQFQFPVKTPETYADIIRELHRIGAIDENLEQRLVQMTKFRNRLVHLYWELDKTEVYKIIQESLDDIKLFEKHGVDFSNHHPLQENM